LHRTGSGHWIVFDGRFYIQTAMAVMDKRYNHPLGDTIFILIFFSL